MKTSSGFFHILASIILVVPLVFQLFASVQTVNADTANDEFNVTLHKRVFDEGQVPADKHNTGDVMSDFGGTGLNGVTFTVYDVTDHYLSLRATGNTAEEATKAVQKDAVVAAPAYANKVTDQLTKTTNQEDGVATFSNLTMKDGKGNYKTYLFVETDSPSNITQKAAPIVLTLPIFKSGSNTEINNDVQIYPKDEQTEAITKDLNDDSKKSLEVTLPNGDKVYNAEYGQTFGYNITVAVPWNIKDKKIFEVVDTPNKGIKADVNSVAITGLKGTDYTVTANGDGFKVTFDTSKAAVQAAAGKKLVVNYDVTLTNDAVPDVAIGNKAELTIGNGSDVKTTPAEGPKVYTGGAKFIKQDKDSHKPLANAEFQLVKVDNSGKVVSYANQAADGKYTWAGTDTNATTYTSNTAGLVEVKGLPYSSKLEEGQSYALIETKAPEGYAKLTAPVKFVVTQGSYADTQKVEIDNITKGLLPSTGGNGIYIYIAAGLVVVVLAAIGYSIAKRREEV